MRSCARVALCMLVCCCAVVLAFPATGLAQEADVDLAQVLAGDVPGLTAQVNGSGLGYYGDALRATFRNTTGEALTVAIPVGMRLVPGDAGVQTMYTAGDEVVVVPPGASDVVLKGFCGEAHDAGPGSEDVFSHDGYAGGDLLDTLRRISREKAFDFDGQTAVWSHTDDYSTTDNPRARELAGGESVPSSRAAAAGLLGAAAAGGAAAALARKRGPAPTGAPTASPAAPPEPPTGEPPPYMQPPPPAPPGTVTAEEPFDPADFVDADYGTLEPEPSDLIPPPDVIVEPPPPDEDLFPPVDEEAPLPEAPPEAPPPAAPPTQTPGTAESPADAAGDDQGLDTTDDAQDATRVGDTVLQWLRDLGPPEEPNRDRQPDETVEKIANVLGAEGGVRSAQREAEYPHASTDPDKQRRIQQEIADETLQQVDTEDWLWRLRIIRALMVTAWTTVSERGEFLFRLLEGGISGVYDNKLPDYTELGPQAMLSQRGLKGLYNDYRDTLSLTESLTVDTPRDRQQVFDELKRTADQRMQIELDWPADSPASFYDDPDYQRIQRRIEILRAMDRAFDYQPRPKLNLD